MPAINQSGFCLPLLLKLLGVTPAKRLYALRLLKRVGVNPHDILKVYVSGNVRSILEYAIQVWQDMSDSIICIQKRALKIRYPECTVYNQARLEANVSSLANRRVYLCRQFVSNMASNHNNPISFLIPKSETRTVCCNLRSGSERTINKLRRSKIGTVVYS